jgi:hypothetical protein
MTLHFSIIKPGETDAHRRTGHTARGQWRKDHDAATRYHNVPTRFVCVDGEGITLADGTHRYVLLGVGNQQVTSPGGLSWEECFQFLWDRFQEEGSKSVAYTGFFLTYDFVQMLRSMPEDRARMLLTSEGRSKRSPRVSARVQPFPVRHDGWEFDILGSKRLRIRPSGQTKWMNICDAGSFFQKSFLKVIDPEEWSDPVVTQDEYDTIVRGKKSRASAALDGDMRRYNRLENEILARVLCRLNEGFQSLGIHLSPSQWYGPGAAAQAWLAGTHKESSTPRAITAEQLSTVVPHPALEAARASYFGGWFEIMAHGIMSGVTHEYDINSAYPYIISTLPCLEHGTWSRGEVFRNPETRLEDGEWTQDAGITTAPITQSTDITDTRNNVTYSGNSRINLSDIQDSGLDIKHSKSMEEIVNDRIRDMDIDSHAIERATMDSVLLSDAKEVTNASKSYTLVYARVHGSHPRIGAMLHRDERGNIYRPHDTEGWYWAHEIDAAHAAGLVYTVDISDSWTYHPCNCPPPLREVRDIYRLRQEVGKKTSLGIACKLVPNSLYGKFAQSIGNPKYANPVYASLITAGCRTMILNAIASHPRGADDVLMVATDGVYFHHEHSGIAVSDDLGDWDHAEKKNICLFKPGVYWDDKARDLIRDGAAPVFKARGVSASDFGNHIAGIDVTFRSAATCGSLQDASTGDPFWPTVEFPVQFSMVSAVQALARNAWDTAGTLVPYPVNRQSSDPSIKRDCTGFYQDGILRSVPRKNHPYEASHPYEKRFGMDDPFSQENAETMGITPDGLPSGLIREALGM